MQVGAGGLLICSARLQSEEGPRCSADEGGGKVGGGLGPRSELFPPQVLGSVRSLRTLGRKGPIICGTDRWAAAAAAAVRWRRSFWIETSRTLPNRS